MIGRFQLVCAALAFVALLGSCSAEPPASDSANLIRQIAAEHRTDFVRMYYPSKVMGKEQAFALFIPKSYDPAKPAPVVIFLHTYWTNYHDKQFYRVTGLPGTVQEQCDKRGWLAVAPEAGGNSWYAGKAEEQVLETVEVLKRYLKVKEDQLYLIGGSMGGAGALSIAAHHPDRVAGVASLAGVSDYVAFVKEKTYLLKDEPGSVRTEFGGTPEDKPDVYRQMSAVHFVEVLKHIPVFLIHGDSDQVVPVEQSRQLAKLLKEAGGKITYKEVPGETHNMEMLEWFTADYFALFDAGR